MSRRALLLVALLAVLVRVGFQLELRLDDGPVGALGTHLLGDERAYDAFARESAAGDLERERAFYQEPLYAWLLGRLYTLWPPAPLDETPSVIPQSGVHLLVIVVQHGLGVLLALLVAGLGARALNPRAGMIAGLLAALSGPAVFHEAMLLKASLSLVALVALLHLWLDLLQGAGRAKAGLAGLALGVGILLRGNLYLLLGLVLASLVLPLGSERRRLGSAGLVLLGALLAIAPASLHNLTREIPDPVLSTYQSGSNAALGQPDLDDARRGVTYEPLRAGRGDAWWEEQDAVALAEAGAGRRLNGAEVSRWWWREVRRRAASRPGVTAQRTLYKLAHLVHGREVADVKDWAFFAPRMPWLGSWASDLWVLGPWALLGFLVLPWRRRPGLLVVRGGVLMVLVTLGLFYVMARYRLTAAPCLWILAAGAMDRAWTWAREGGWRARTGVLLAAVLSPLLVAAWNLPSDVRGDELAATEHVGLGAVLALPPLHAVPIAGSHHTSWVNAATVEKALAVRSDDALSATRHRDRAVEYARAALASAPLYPRAHATLVGVLALELPGVPGRRAEGLAQAWRMLLVMEALRTGVPAPQVAAWLTGSEARVGARVDELLDRASAPGGEDYAGPLLAEAGRWVAEDLLGRARALPAERAVEARELLERGLTLARRSARLQPDDGLGHALLGALLKGLGRPDEALQAYRQALALGEDSAVVHNNLGNLLLGLGQPSAARAAFEQALLRAPGDPLVTRNVERARAAEAAANDDTDR